jgi:hypothetical protein
MIRYKMEMREMTQYTFDDSLISDLHKDAYGMRPTQTFWTLWESMTPSQKQCEWEWLCKLVDEAEQRRAEMANEAYLAWSVQITELMADHGISEARAIIWDMQTYNVGIEDLSMYCYKRGLDYSTEMEISKLLEKVA